MGIRRKESYLPAECAIVRRCRIKVNMERHTRWPVVIEDRYESAYIMLAVAHPASVMIHDHTRHLLEPTVDASREVR